MAKSASKPQSMNVSWSRISEWITCHWRYHLSYEEHWSPKREAEPLYYGSIFHSVLAHLYGGQKGNPQNPRTMKAAVNKFLTGMKIPKVHREVVEEYCLVYAAYMQENRAREPQRILAIEFPFMVPLDFDKFKEFTGAYPPLQINFIGIIDLIAAWPKKVEVWDHKLQSNHPDTGSLDHPPISYPQMGIYSWVTGKLGAYIPRFVLNVYGKRRKSKQIQRYPVMIHPRESLEWEKWLYRIIGDMLSSPDRTKSLGSMSCGRCHFRYPCQKHQSQGESGLQTALKHEYHQPPYSGPRVTWKTAFPPALIAQIKESQR